MSEEKREILEHLVEYLQDKIDTGYHKIFYNDDMYDEKTIDCINAINDTLEENKRLNKENEELKKNQKLTPEERNHLHLELDEIVESLQLENERLNNIINEYTKWLNEQVDYMTHHSIERMIAFDCCKHKLQELKGSDKD